MSLQNLLSKSAGQIAILLGIWLVWTTLIPLSDVKGQALQISKTPNDPGKETLLVGTAILTPSSDEKIENPIKTEAEPGLYGARTSVAETPKSLKHETSKIVQPPTFAPTATPGVVTKLIDEMPESIHAQQFRFPNLTTSDWINLGVSLLVILVGGFVLGGLLVSFLINITKLTPTTRDDEFSEQFAPRFT